MRLGLVGAVDLEETVNAGFGRPIIRIWRVVAQGGVLDQEPDDIDAKSIDAAVEPEAQHVVHRDCASSDPVAVARSYAGSTGRFAPRAPRPVRRIATANCWAAIRRSCRRARCTSRASDWRATRGFRETKDDVPRCDWERNRE